MPLFLRGVISIYGDGLYLMESEVAPEKYLQSKATAVVLGMWYLERSR